MPAEEPSTTERAVELLLAAGYVDPGPAWIAAAAEFLARCDAARDDAERRRDAET